MFLGVIADDFTGATDIAGFLVKNGLSTVQLSGPADFDLPEGVQAVVVCHKSRSCPSEEAIETSLKTLGYLEKLGCEQIFFKYCSTFDSTEKGNIGPVTDALMHALGAQTTVIAPALPVNRRTVYMGNLFVGDVPLNESGMRNHPLNPMRDANLMRLMQAQAEGQAGLVPWSTVRLGVEAVRERIEALRAQGVRYVVPDALEDSDLDTLAQAVLDMKLVTGGSGLGGALARLWSQKGQGQGKSNREVLPRPGKTILMSGSCSVMSQAQVAAYAKRGPLYEVKVEECLQDAQAYAERIAAQTLSLVGERMPPLVAATVSAERLAQIQRDYGVEPSRMAIESFFAAYTRLCEQAGVVNYIIAGGETSSIVSQTLGVRGFFIGEQIAPGVPWVRTLDDRLALALKSGNFGAETFFTDALSYIGKHAEL